MIVLNQVFEKSGAELHFAIDAINKRFGENAVYIGDSFGNIDYKELLKSEDLGLLKVEAVNITKQYKNISRKIAELGKANQIRVVRNNIRQLEKKKEEVGNLQNSIEIRIKSIEYLIKDRKEKESKLPEIKPQLWKRYHWESKDRYNIVILQQDLFHQWSIIRANGGKRNKLGGTEIKSFGNYKEAEQEIKEIAKIRKSHKYRLIKNKGY